MSGEESIKWKIGLTQWKSEGYIRMGVWFIEWLKERWTSAVGLCISLVQAALENINI